MWHGNAQYKMHSLYKQDKKFWENKENMIIFLKIPIIKMRRSWDRLKFIMGIPIPVRRHLYIETPRLFIEPLAILYLWWFPLYLDMAQCKMNFCILQVLHICGLFSFDFTGTLVCALLKNRNAHIGFSDQYSILSFFSEYCINVLFLYTSKILWINTYSSFSSDVECD